MMRIIFRLIPLIILLIPGFLLGDVISPNNKFKIGIGIFLITLILMLVNRKVTNGLLNNIYYGISGFLLLFLSSYILFLVIRMLNKYLFKVDGLDPKLKIASLFLAVILTVYSVYSAYALKVTNYNIDIAKKESTLDNYKVTFISDIHIGEGLSYKRLDDIVDMVNKQNSDLVVIGGDLFDMGLDDVKKEDEDKVINSLNRIEAKNGAIFVLGNHDLYTKDKEAVVNLVKKFKVNVLVDENKIIGNAINVFGLHDMGSDKTNVVTGNNLPTIIVSHKPEDNPSFKNGELVLSGHTHGGQIFPAGIVVKKFFKYVYGYYKNDDLQIIVSSGAGFWGFPMRLFTKSEVVNINIKLK